MKEIVGASGLIPVSPARAWEVISSLGGLDKWFPLVSACRLEGSGVGAKRFCTLANGEKLQERIEEVDDSQMRVRYSITASGLPLEGYVGTVVVRAIGAEETELSWHAEYSAAPEHAADLRETFRGAIVDGINGLASFCGQRASGAAA